VPVSSLSVDLIDFLKRKIENAEAMGIKRQQARLLVPGIVNITATPNPLINEG
jgi:hypothetical protein